MRRLSKALEELRKKPASEVMAGLYQAGYKDTPIWVRVPHRNVAIGGVRKLVVQEAIREMQENSISWEVWRSVFSSDSEPDTEFKDLSLRKKYLSGLMDDFDEVRVLDAIDRSEGIPLIQREGFSICGHCYTPFMDFKDSFLYCPYCGQKILQEGENG